MEDTTEMLLKAQQESRDLFHNLLASQSNESQLRMQLQAAEEALADLKASFQLPPSSSSSAAAASWRTVS